MTIIDSSARYRGAIRVARPRVPAAQHDTVVLAPGLDVVERDDRCVQLGVEPTRRILVRHPPPGTADVLRAMSRGIPLTVAARRTAVRHRVRPDTWDAVVAELLAAGYLVRTSAAAPRPDRPPARRPEPNAGPVEAEDPGDAVTDLADAVAVVVGTGRVASSLATLLAAAGTGHVHLDPDRALRPGDAVPGGPSTADLAGAATVLAFDGDRHRGLPRRGTLASRPARDVDRETLAAVVRRARPDVAVHRPAGYVRPGLVILAGDGPASPDVTRRLVSEGQPHLAVSAGEVRGVVGPLVLPGRTSCLNCHDLHRRDADAGWPRVQLELRHTVVVPPVVMASTVAALAADQALQYLRGSRPATVDGTLECTAGEWRVRRRSWRFHEACACHLR